MQFNVILNRKGEKILTIHGFNEGNENDYGQEDDEKNDDKTLFLNLNRLFKKQEEHILDGE